MKTHPPFPFLKKRFYVNTASRHKMRKKKKKKIREEEKELLTWKLKDVTSDLASKK